MKSKEVISSEKDALQWLYGPSISGTLDQKFARTEKKKKMPIKEGKERKKQNKKTNKQTTPPKKTKKQTNNNNNKKPTTKEKKKESSRRRRLTRVLSIVFADSPPPPSPLPSPVSQIFARPIILVVRHLCKYTVELNSFNRHRDNEVM